MIPDKVDVIADELRKFSRDFSLVLTSGGIGPTHDDVTYEAAAAAFDDRLEENAYLGSFVQSWFKTSDRSKPCFKLAQIPSRATLNFSADKANRFPVVSVNGNVYIFPGIPHLLRNGFEAVCVDIFKRLSTQKFFLLKCFINRRETEIAERLNALVAKHPEVSFGSYPDLFNAYYKTKITLESTSQEIAERALKELQDVLPVIQYDGEPTVDAMEKIRAFSERCEDSDMVRVLDEAMEHVEKCFADYLPDEVVVCFNGGKDCIVMLHLIHAHFAARFPDARLRAFYVRERNPFDEIEAFVDETAKAYDLDMTKLDGPMKGALRRLLEDNPSLKACVLGTRDGDPGSQYQVGNQIDICGVSSQLFSYWIIDCSWTFHTFFSSIQMGLFQKIVLKYISCFTEHLLHDGRRLAARDEGQPHLRLGIQPRLEVCTRSDAELPVTLRQGLHFFGEQGRHREERGAQVRGRGRQREIQTGLRIARRNPREEGEKEIDSQANILAK